MNLKHKLILLICATASSAVAQIKVTPNASSKNQTANSVPKDWHLQSLEKDKVYGTGVNLAYTELLAGKKSTKTIVAVIDNGIDTLHADLKTILWTNPKDRGHGWNFLGSNDGKYNIINNSKEADREFIRLNQRYEKNINTPLKPAEKKYFDYVKSHSPYAQKLRGYNNLVATLDLIPSIDSALKAEYPGQPVTRKQLEEYALKMKGTPTAEAVMFMFLPSTALKIDTPVTVVEKFYRAQKVMKDLNSEALRKAWVLANTDFKQGINDQNGKQYGNKLLSFNSDHGTHVSGIIAADRKNNIGINGIADNVEIMTLRAIPQGDEYDIDVANAIRYAVDNGARVINMSFGKRFSPNKKLVDEAIQYAEKKQVLIVKAAGNDAENVDSLVFYPSAYYDNGTKATNVITVGASDLNGIIANFSSYGKKAVDIFAPGVDIYSSWSANNYAYKSGTSMATPVVAGIASLILSYYPKFSPAQVIDILKKTTTPAPQPSSKYTRKIAENSVSGGIVNAYQALKLAEELYKTI